VLAVWPGTRHFQSRRQDFHDDHHRSWSAYGDPEIRSAKILLNQQIYRSIEPGYHMNKKHWISIFAGDDISEDLLVDLINDSRNLVVDTLAKKISNVCVRADCSEKRKRVTVAFCFPTGARAVELEIYQVDAFSTRPFSGNPAGVCITPRRLKPPPCSRLRQRWPSSETAFLARDDNRLRWFTPQAEVDLCGHGTLATAHILRQTGQLAVGESVVFTTLSGPLKATARPDTIELDFRSSTGYALCAG
jgi:hypothetical protein